MSTNLRKLADRVASDIHPGEQLLAAVQAMPAGQAEQQIVGGALLSQLGVVSAVATDPIDTRWSGPAEADRAAAGVDSGSALRVLVGLTDRRLLLWTVAGFRARPKALVAAIDRTDIERIELGTTSLFGISQPEIIVDTTAGTSFGLAVAKVHRADAAALVAAAGP